MEIRAIAALAKQKSLVNPTARPHRYPLPERDGWIGIWDSKTNRWPGGRSRVHNQHRTCDPRVQQRESLRLEGTACFLACSPVARGSDGGGDYLLLGLFPSHSRHCLSLLLGNLTGKPFVLVDRWTIGNQNHHFIGRCEFADTQLVVSLSCMWLRRFDPWSCSGAS